MERAMGIPAKALPVVPDTEARKRDHWHPTHGQKAIRKMGSGSRCSPLPRGIPLDALPIHLLLEFPCLYKKPFDRNKDFWYLYSLTRKTHSHTLETPVPLQIAYVVASPLVYRHL
jgi:hypothetical protein